MNTSSENIKEKKKKEVFVQCHNKCSISDLLTE